MRRVWDEDPILESAEPDGQPRAGDGAADGPIAAGADPGRGKPFDAPATPLLELLVDGATGAGKPTVLEWSPLCRVEDVPGAMGDAAVDGSSSGAGTTWAPAPAPLASSLNGGADAAPRVDPVLVSIGQVNPSRGTVCVRPHLQALVPWAPGQDVPLSQASLLRFTQMFMQFATPIATAVSLVRPPKAATLRSACGCDVHWMQRADL